MQTAAGKATNRSSRSLKQTRSFSLEREVIQELEETKGSQSTSEWANQLLKTALEAEKYARLEDEARQFYGSINDRDETRPFRSASARSWAGE